MKKERTTKTLSIERSLAEAIEKQYDGDIAGKGSVADKQLYANLQTKKSEIETEIEKKKIAALKNQFKKKVKKLEQEIQGIQIKTYSGIWKDDVTTVDYAKKATGIQAKKEYFLNKLNAGGLSDTDKEKVKLFLKDLDEFAAEGKRYADIQAAIKSAKERLTALKKGGILDSNSPFSQDRKDAALWAKTPEAADNALRDVCGEVWKNASKAESEAIYDYTRFGGI